MAQRFRLLNEQQVHSLLPMNDLIAAMESALAKFSSRDVLQPVRSVIDTRGCVGEPANVNGQLMCERGYGGGYGGAYGQRRWHPGY